MNHKPECNEKWEYDKDHCICSWIKKAEQRILKLLEDNLKMNEEFVEFSVDTARTQSYMHGLEESIALIKGENK